MMTNTSANTPFPKANDSELSIDDYMTLVEVDALMGARASTKGSLNPNDSEYVRVLLLLQSKAHSGSATHMYIELLMSELGAK